MKLRDRFFPGTSHWTIESGSALDSTYLDSLGQFDIVYSWGVLHHTGDMWRALENVIPPVGPGGRLFISIYGSMGTRTRRWRAIKKLYVSSNRATQWAILLSLWTSSQLKAAAGRLSRLENPLPLRIWSEYRQRRGMSAWHDFVDWVGGYPYETAKVEEIFDFYRDRGFYLEYLRTGGLGCNEFIFVRGVPNTQGEVAKERREMQALPA
jgi:2-polyprenyl-6-hydroxyphenyl methylase/3-demethylubiquinone-9 3-methyltransferase